MDEFCSIKEASRILGVSPKTIQLWVENGSLKAWKTVGGHRRVLRDSIANLMNTRHHEAASTRIKITPQSQRLNKEPTAHTDVDLTRVLVVEDEEVLRRLYEFNIKKWGDSIHIDMAKDGFEALLKIGKAKPHVLITDLSMPGMDGFKMLRRLDEYAEVGSMLIIVVTSYDSDEIESLGRLPKGVHLFQKPAPFKAIRKLVSNTLGNAGI